MPQINCPSCGGRLLALATRQAKGNAIRRWRQCDRCGKAVTTYERVQQLEREAVAGEPMVSVMEAAAMLGINKTSMYEQVRVGAIPAWKLGQRIWVPKRWVEQTIANRSRDWTMTADVV